MHLGLLDGIPKSGVQRRRIMDFIYSLRDSPYTAGDFSNKVGKTGEPHPDGNGR